jgi:hypothetical protein
LGELSRDVWVQQMVAGVVASGSVSDEQRACLEQAFGGLSGGDVDRLVRSAATGTTLAGENVSERVLRSCGVDPAELATP